jgi:hypothetical protein
MQKNTNANNLQKYDFSYIFLIPQNQQFEQL